MEVSFSSSVVGAGGWVARLKSIRVRGSNCLSNVRDDEKCIMVFKDDAKCIVVIAGELEG